MDEQLAFYSIILNWAFTHNIDDSEPIHPNNTAKDASPPNNTNNNALEEPLEPPHKKRKMNDGTQTASTSNPTLATPPPLEPTEGLSNITISRINQRSPQSPLVMKIPKKQNQTNDEPETIHLTEPSQHEMDIDDAKPNPSEPNDQKKPRFKRPVALKSNNYKSRSQHQRQQEQSSYDELFPVEKFKKLTKFHRNQDKAEQLSKICTFPNATAYKEHFGSLLFDDLRARLEGTIHDELRTGRARDMLPAKLIHEIGHDEYICCSFQILSKSEHWMSKVNNRMLVLVIYNLPDTNWKFKSVQTLPHSHILGIVSELPTQSHIKLQIHLSCDDERYQPFMECFEDDTSNEAIQLKPTNSRKRTRRHGSGKRKAMKIVFLENVQNRMREFRAICSAGKLRLKHIIMDPKSVIIQQQFCSQQPEYTIAMDTNSTATEPGHTNKDISMGSSWVWSHVPDAYRKRLCRHLNSSQCKAIEKACQHKGVTLLQGPPGTGKTRTVLHIMNAFHIARTQAMFQSWLRTMYNRFHARLNIKKKLKEPIDLTTHGHSSSNSNGYTLQDVMRDVSQNQLSSKLRDDQDVLDKPRILVAAPSNAAVDEIIIRLMEQQFVDGNDIKYRPPITRIGNMQKCRVEVGQQVSLQSKVDAFLNHRYDTSKYDQQVKMNKLSDRIRFFKEKKAENEQKLANFVKSRLTQFGTMDFESFQISQTGEIIHFLQEIHKYSKELQRCVWVKTLSRKAAQDKLMLSILLESEIIFTTLNSAGGRELRLLLSDMRLKSSTSDTSDSSPSQKQLFDHCIIDEAGQCTEPDILIPLIYDIDSVVLVGDPQQLPATVFSQGPSAWLYERSLFERLMTAQYPVHLLDTQYRMHPEISHFPNVHFYGDKLNNGENVLGPGYMKPFHSDLSSLFKPFLFFNISSNESRSGHSLYNMDEVGFMLQHLQLFYSTYSTQKADQMSIGIITPYKQQQKKIIEALKRAPGLQKKNIEVATVDFYQGREKDIIFFSCVRAGGQKGIGFLADIRRMNVAITRARYSLWIVGNQSSLQKNPDWKRLIKHARDRKCMRCLQYDKQNKRYKLITHEMQQQLMKNMNNNKRGRGRGRGKGKGRGRGRGHNRGRGRGRRGRGRRGRGRGYNNNNNKQIITIPRPILMNNKPMIDYGVQGRSNVNGHHNSLNDSDFYGENNNNINMQTMVMPQPRTVHAQFQQQIAIAHPHHLYRPHIVHTQPPAQLIHRNMYPQPLPPPYHMQIHTKPQTVMIPQQPQPHQIQHPSPRNQPNEGAFTDFTKTHLNSSAFDE